MAATQSGHPDECQISANNGNSGLLYISTKASMSMNHKAFQVFEWTLVYSVMTLHHRISF